MRSDFRSATEQKKGLVKPPTGVVLLIFIALMSWIVLFGLYHMTTL